MSLESPVECSGHKLNVGAALKSSSLVCCSVDTTLYLQLVVSLRGDALRAVLTRVRAPSSYFAHSVELILAILDYLTQM